MKNDLACPMIRKSSSVYVLTHSGFVSINFDLFQSIHSSLWYCMYIISVYSASVDLHASASQPKIIATSFLSVVAVSWFENQREISKSFSMSYFIIKRKQSVTE